MSVAQQLAAYMRENGFSLIRTGKHFVWSNGVHTIVTSRSPSDRRALLNARTLVKRKRRTG